MFDVNGKVAVITGGAIGIGLETAKELLKGGAKGITIADLDPKAGKDAVQDLTKEFGTGKVIFVQTDVSNKESFKNAFEKTVSTFKNVDILVNNAGIFTDYNYEKEIAVNITGVVHGIVLGQENYISKYKSGAEGVILNLSSIVGVYTFPALPIYGGTKWAVSGLTANFGADFHYQRTKVRVVAVAPGFTDTNLFPEYHTTSINKEVGQLTTDFIKTHIRNYQSPNVVAKAIVQIIKEKESGTIWVSDNNKPIYEERLPPYDFQ